MFGFEMMSSWTYIPLQIERIIALYFPLHAKSWIRKRRAVITVTVISLCCAALCSSLLAGGSMAYMDAQGT